MLNSLRDERTLSSLPMTLFKYGFVLAISALLILSSVDVIAGKKPVVVVNPSVSQSALKLKDLRSIYTMKKNTWSDGSPVTVFVLSNNAITHKDFCRSLLKVFPRQLEAVWHRLVYSGTGERPIEVGSEKEMMDRVTNTPGAIGYVQSEVLDENARILSIK